MPSFFIIWVATCFYYMGGPKFLLYGWPHVFIIWVAHSFYYMGGQMILLYGWPIPIFNQKGGGLRPPPFNYVLSLATHIIKSLGDPYNKNSGPPI